MRRLILLVILMLCPLCFGMVADNNVFNLKSLGKQSWVGEVGQVKNFAVFQSQDYACRAFVRNARTQYHRGARSVTAFLQRYAPPSENNTSRYVQFVCSRLRIGAQEDMRLFLDGKPNTARLVSLTQAIAKFETGTLLPASVILRGIELEAP